MSRIRFNFSNNIQENKVYRPHPNNGARVHASENNQTPRTRSRAPLIVIGLAAMPFTITLYRSKAIAVMVQMETHPKSEPPVAYSWHASGPVIIFGKSLVRLVGF